MLNTTNRDLFDQKTINLIISFHGSIKLLYIGKKNVVWYKNQILEKIFTNFLLQNNIVLYKEYFLYLKRNGEILRKLNKSKKICYLQLESNDEILVSYKEIIISKNQNEVKEIKEEPTIKNEFDENNKEIEENKRIEEKIVDKKIEEKEKKGNLKIMEYIENENKQNQKNRIFKVEEKELKTNINNSNDLNIYNYKKPLINYKNKKILFIIILISLILIGISIFLIIKYIIKKPKNKNEEEINEEIEIITDMPIEYKKEDLIINKKYPLNLLLRFNMVKNTEMEIEAGNSSENIVSEISDFIFIVREEKIEKDEINLIEKELFIGYICLLNHSMSNETEDMLTIYDKQLNKYLNYNQTNITVPDLKYVGEEGNLCFVKIEFYLNGEIKNYYLPNGFSQNDTVYIEDISELIIPKISSNLFSKNISEKINEIISLNYTNINETSPKRRLKKKYKKYTIPNRNLEETNDTDINDTNNNTYNNDTDNNDDIEVDDIIIEDYLEEPTSESIDYDLREAQINLDENTNQNFSNLTQFKMNSIESDELKMEDSVTNTTIYSIIDEEGILQSVQKKTFSSMYNPESENNEDYENNNEEESNNNNINFNISSIFIINSLLINRTEYFINESLNNNLYEYFDNFTYNIYKQEINNSSDEIYEENDVRNLNEYVSYYGFKRIINDKYLYKYNILGLNIQKKIYTEIIPETGTANSYFVMTFGNKNIKIKISEQQTNLHIILAKKNQMAYNLLQLLKQSNIDLKKRNEKYIDIIINIENNISNYLKDYDYSGVFQDSLDNLYKQVSNFSGEVFHELIDLINRIYDNYTEILNNTINDKYDCINEIMLITREEYIKYIYNMIDIIEIFENNTMIFFENMEKELRYLNNFHIDLLYDIIDIINEAKLIYKQFNNNLFNSIEKGILSYNYDLKNFIDEIMSDILYLLDFLSVNINKNDLIKKEIDYNTRMETSSNLKKIKNIINTILEMIVSNIKNDYELQMNLDNENGIKNYSLQKQNEFLTKTAEKSNKLIGNIKSKINNIELYELYTENIDNINNIINKTISEYINDIYNNIISNSLNIKQEYLDEESNLIKNRKILFEISDDIVKQINLEINEINNYISNYTNDFIDENIYKIYYNMYHFKSFFDNKEIKNIFNQFISMFYELVKAKINEIKGIIDYNFNLAFDDLKNLEFLKQKSEFVKLYLCTDFIKRYNQYIDKFKELLNLIYKDDFSNLFQKYFFKLKNDIINYVKNKSSSLNKFYFDTNLYEQNFYFVESIKNEILQIIQNIDNYFNENIFIKEIKVTSLFEKDLIPYHNKKMEELYSMYNSIYEKTNEPHVYECEYDFAVYKKVCKTWFIICWRKKWQMYFYDILDKEKINLVQTKIYYSDNQLIKETNNIYNNYIKKFEYNLGNIIFSFQNLYSNLYQNVENKIKNSKIKILLDNYKNNFNNLMSLNDNNNILQKINNIEENLNNNLHELEKNINLLNETYFNLYYLPNNEQFIEYPEEIIFKINQFQKELIYNTDNIIKVIDIIYKNRINNIINSTNLYINTIINEDYKYILININSTNILSKYTLSKYGELKTFFENCNAIVKSKNSQIYNEDKINLERNNLFSYIYNYNKSLDVLKNKSSNFIYYLEDLINQTFIIPSENCTYDINNYTSNYIYNNTDNYTYNNISINEINETFYNFSQCQKEKKHIGENYSKYNCNIVKLRSGIFYTKTLFENIDSFFDDINIENLININNINYYDNLLNDKNIFNFYNETNYILNQIKTESNNNLEEPLQNLIEYLNNKYLYKNDYSKLLEKFKEIISFKNNDFNNNITNKKEDIINNVFIILNEFNKTLFKQISLINNYNIYNINETYFKNIYTNYQSLIENLFKEYKNKINSLSNNYKFHNIIKKIFKEFFDKKKEYYKHIINEFSNIYILNIFDSVFDIGEYQSNSIQNLFNDYELSKKYEYIEIYENNTSTYIYQIISIINTLDLKIKEKFKNIYDNFYKIFNKNITFYVNNNFVDELNNNYTICLEYKEIKSFNNKIEFINIIFENCSYNETNITILIILL